MRDAPAVQVAQPPGPFRVLQEVVGLQRRTNDAVGVTWAQNGHTWAQMGGIPENYKLSYFAGHSCFGALTSGLARVQMVKSRDVVYDVVV
jgi:hypothetical protein